MGCRVKKVLLGSKGIPFAVTHDGRSIRYPDPDVKANDTLMINIASHKITKLVKFELGNLATVTRGRNAGRIGTVTHQERHSGSYTIVTIRDAAGNDFATRIENVFVVGEGNKPMVSLPKSKGVRLTIIQEQAKHHSIV